MRSYSPTGTGRIEQIVSHIPLVFILEVDSPDFDAETVERGSLAMAYGVPLIVRQIMLRDKSTTVYRFRVEAAIRLSDLRDRAIILRAYESGERDNFGVDPVPF